MKEIVTSGLPVGNHVILVPWIGLRTCYSSCLPFCVKSQAGSTLQENGK